ncbi:MULTISPECIES: arylamine N-acetyltransferase family protein [unclassified Streptomyces]|uniref:arylamine N-acetyltransferase family protein n=1 Tax=unclassified Streptomyces TaxID=2593676 RepID=UPI00081BC557|nr:MULTISPECIES: arylamine N-acetyltransferase [unclassified Streptomyces]MYQ88966.1 arylamine N-acetyltransferase [Streptomyces sp. SID4936]SCE57051.1 N-hydroxyarylamine O-acetyltransferase [Streptomyces sp. DvalAA-43]
MTSDHAAETGPRPAPALDLAAYLTRIGWAGERRPTARVLRSVHRAHALGIPFENLEPVLGGAPSLAIADLEAKLVRGGRGGYCYEHNTLLAAALTALGFRITLLCARVVVGAGPGEIRPRTHMLMLAGVPGERTPYLADVGFGSVGALLEPLPLAAGAEVADTPRRHRLVNTPHDGPLAQWELQAHTPDGAWESQYAFTVEPFEAPDYEVINWHIATNPRSPFSRRVYAQRTTPDSHLSLTGRTLTVTAPDGTREVRELSDGDEVLRVLAADFGIRVPPGTRLPE